MINIKVKKIREDKEIYMTKSRFIKFCKDAGVEDFDILFEKIKPFGDGEDDEKYSAFQIADLVSMSKTYKSEKAFKYVLSHKDSNRQLQILSEVVRDYYENKFGEEDKDGYRLTHDMRCLDKELWILFIQKIGTLPAELYIKYELSKIIKYLIYFMQVSYDIHPRQIHWLSQGFEMCTSIDFLIKNSGPELPGYKHLDENGYYDFEMFLKNKFDYYYNNYKKIKNLDSVEFIKKLGWERKDNFLYVLFKYDNESNNIVNYDRIWSLVRELLTASEHIIKDLAFDDSNLGAILKREFPKLHDSPTTDNIDKCKNTNDFVKVILEYFPKFNSNGSIDTAKKQLNEIEIIRMFRLSRNWAAHNGDNPNYIVSGRAIPFIVSNAVFTVLYFWHKKNQKSKYSSLPNVNTVEQYYSSF